MDALDQQYYLQANIGMEIEICAAFDCFGDSERIVRAKKLLHEAFKLAAEELLENGKIESQPV